MFMRTILNPDANFEAFTVVMFQVEVFLALTPGSVVVGYQRFQRSVLPPSSGYPTTTLNGVTTRKTST